MSLAERVALMRAEEQCAASFPRYRHERWRVTVRGVCSVLGCGRPVEGRGLCSRHYARERRRDR